MAITITAVKNRRTLVAAGTSNAAGGTTQAIWGDGTTGVAGCALPTAPDVCTILGKVTVGTNTPTVAATVTIEVSGDGSTNWEQVALVTTGTTASTTYPFRQDLPLGSRFCRVTFAGNAAQAVTVEAYGEEVTSFITSP